MRRCISWTRRPSADCARQHRTLRNPQPLRSPQERSRPLARLPDACALQTDFYELTMAAGYFEAGKTQERATFELYVRRLPYNRKFILAAGLAQAVEYLLNLRFTSEEIAYLRGLPQFERTHPEFFEMLANLRFTGDLFAV